MSQFHPPSLNPVSLSLETQQFHPTENAYRQWVKTLGAPTTKYQLRTVQEILGLARRLDQLQRTSMTKPTQVDLRLRLLQQIRHLSADLRQSVADEKIIRSVAHV